MRQIKNTVWMIALLAVASIGLAACASLIHGTDQMLTFHMTPETTECVISRDMVDIATVTTQYNTATINKGRNNISVVCVAPGYKMKRGRLVSKTQPTGAVGVFFMPDHGLTDFATGAMWKYPGQIYIDLEPQ